MKKLYDGPSQFPLERVDLTQNSLASGRGSVGIKLPGGLPDGSTSVAWDGTNNGGQMVESGTYYFKVENTDPFGHVTVISKEIPVVKALVGNTLSLFNSAGEVVGNIPLGAYPDPIVDFRLESSVFAAAYDPATGQAFNPLKIILKDAKGVEHTLLWDGRNGAGRALDSGSYTLRLLWDAGGGSVAVAARELVVIKAPDAALPEIAVAPNPASGGVREIFVTCKPAPGSGVKASLYNLAGELVGVGAPCGNPALLSLDVSRLATGIYVVAVQAGGDKMGAGTKTIKIAILK